MIVLINLYAPTESRTLTWDVLKSDEMIDRIKDNNVEP